MPAANLVLMLLVGTVIGTAAGVLLRGRRAVFVVNMALGIVGAALGTFFPYLIGRTAPLDIASSDYLMRAVFGAFLLVVLAGLFRSARPTPL